MTRWVLALLIAFAPYKALAIPMSGLGLRELSIEYLAYQGGSRVTNLEGVDVKDSLAFNSDFDLFSVAFLRCYFDSRVHASQDRGGAIRLFGWQYGVGCVASVRGVELAVEKFHWSQHHAEYYGWASGNPVENGTRVKLTIVRP